MSIYSISYGKGDYAYSIAYHQGNNDLQLDTNEEPLSSMVIAKEAVAAAVREYAEIGDNFEVVIQKVKFGDEKKDHTISFLAQTFSKDIWPRKIIRQAMSISTPGKRETDVAADRASLLVHIEELRGEVEKYVSGKRAQYELFQDDEEMADDIEIEDIEAGQEEIDVPGFDMFDE